MAGTDRGGTVLVDAFAGRPPVPVRPGATAPLGWWPAICVALVAFVDRVEYNLLAGVVPQLQEEFGLSDKAVGAIPTAGAIAGVVLLLPLGLGAWIILRGGRTFDADVARATARTTGHAARHDPATT
ncbi:hypothetical protein AB0H83_05320 [Dactylosporangium sp. NPDC050688]|uniref:hypothetical protein n=1 Tax=Dactylosporangium sp. NPDC050688 TaxID=3157217 RepID=UPI0033F2785C